MSEFENTMVTLFTIDCKLIDVTLDNRWLCTALDAQRECEARGEPFVVRLFNDDRPEDPPIFATGIYTLPVFDASIPYRMERFNWKN